MTEAKFERFKEFAEKHGLKEEEIPGVDGKEAYVRLIAQEVGMPAYENDRKELSRINETFWAALYAHENVTLYDPDSCQFYRYNKKNGAYELLTAASIREEIDQRIYQASFNWPEKWRRLQRFRTASILNAVVAHLCGRLERRDAFVDRPDIIHCANCVLCFSPEKGEYCPRMFNPKHFSRHASPITYDPQFQCPQFEKRLLGHLSEQNVLTLQKASGLALIGRNLIQKIFILEGASAASKGAFLEVLKLITGEINCDELRVDLLQERFEIAGISAKSLLFGADVPGNFLSMPGASRLKALVGGDLLACEFKGSMNRGTVRGEFNVMITSNSRLRIWLDSDREAWKRRLVIVTYENGYNGKTEPDIAMRLVKEEGPGILNWCIKGAEKLMEDINQTGNIMLSSKERERVDTLLDESDSIRIFLKENVIRGDADISTMDIEKAYMDFCLEREWQPQSIRSIENALPNLMSSLFGVLRSNNLSRNGKTIRGYRGVKFNNA